MLSKQLVLIDADVLCYIVGSLASSEDEAFTMLCDRISSLTTLRPCKGYLLFVSCPSKTGFRRMFVTSTYKENRKGAKRPPFYQVCREILLEEMGAIMLPGLEADDVISIHASLPSHKNSTVVSADKDFYSTPCNFLHVNFKRKDFIYTVVDKHTAFYNLMVQVLVGDTADGYRGCKGIGEKKVLDILSISDTMSDMWDKVVKTYISREQTEGDAISTVRLAYLLQHDDYDIKTGTVTLWTPERKIK